MLKSNILANLISKTALHACTMPELYMARTCKWGVLRVVGGALWMLSGVVVISRANTRLAGWEGLDGQIHAKAGKELTQVTRNICLEKRKINAPPCAVTNNVVTEPYDLANNFKHILHVVGPDCRRPSQDESRRLLLPETYHNLFDRVKEMKDVKTIVAPPISMGIFGNPHREGARITLEVLLKHLNGEEDPGFNEYIMVIKERNFISNMRTVYRCLLYTSDAADE